MSQHDYSLANQSRTSFRTDLNNALGAILSLNSGTTAPTTTAPYMFWADTTTNTLKQRNAADSGWVVRDTLDETFVLSRSSNTILDISDRGKFVRFTSTFTQTFDAAAMLGDGWHIDFINEGTGIITFDPNGSETIDGATTLAVRSGESGRIVCNGTNFRILGRRIGTATNDNATAGNIGEYVSDTVAGGAAVSLSSGVAANITSISLTAGDWDVSLQALFSGGGTTVVGYGYGSISAVSATLDDTLGRLCALSAGADTLFAGGAVASGHATTRISLNATTTIYFVAQAGFSASTMSAFGTLQARRVR